MNVPGPRTNPTVQQPMKNRKSLRNWEMRLGLTQVVVLVGVITGSMVLAFYLGLNSGQTVGFETALARAAANVPRLPVPGMEMEEGKLPQDDGAFDVYAKLNDAMPGAKGEIDPIKVAPLKEAEGALGHESLFPTDETAQKAAGGMPELGSIKSVDSAPLIDPATEAVLHAKIEEKAATLGDVGKAVSAAESGAAATVDEPMLKKEETLASAAKVEKKNPAVEVKAETPKELAEPVKKADAAASSVKPVSKSTLLKKNLSRGWYAQVVALQSRQEAEDVAQKLKGSGFGVVIEPALVGGVNYYRIVVGPESSKEQAQRLADQLKRESVVKAPPFLRVVK